jgi:hypothetical protein
VVRVTGIGRLQDGFDILPASDEFRNAESACSPAFILPACEISNFSKGEDNAILASHDAHHGKLRSATINSSGGTIERTKYIKELGTANQRGGSEDIEPYGRLDYKSHAFSAGYQCPVWRNMIPLENTD